MLAGRLISVQEDERRRLAREIHDAISQRLAVLAIEAGKLEQQLQLSRIPLYKNVADLKEGLVKISGDVHALSYELHPSIIEDLGLIAAIESECRRFSRREGVRVDFEPKFEHHRMPNAVAVNLYRIAQEGLRNIAKHSQATQASISLTAQGDALRFAIKDNGLGFDSSKSVHKTGLGLASMKEQVHLIQGKISTKSQTGQGTVIEIIAPLARDAIKAG